MKRKIKVLIADDHEVVRTGLATIVDYEDDMRCVGTAKNGRTAIDLTASEKPDVVIMDLMMPVVDGIAATREIAAASPGSRVLILTSFGSAQDLQQALDNGAAGAMLKSSSNDEILSAVRKIAEGRQVVSREITQLLKIAPPPAKVNLRPRQLEVLNALTRGYSNTEIAHLLGITRSRVKKDLVVIFELIGASSRTEASAIAIRDHLLQP